MKRVSLFALALGLVGATHTSTTPAAASPAQPVQPVSQAPAVLQLPSGTGNASSQFAFDFYSRVRTDKNVFVGPSSLHTALSMTALGAKGTTASQMAAVLHADADPKKIVNAAQEDQRALDAARGTGAQLRSSNRVFAANGFPFTASYTSDVNKGFNVTPENLNFLGAPEPSRIHINQEISGDTNAKIPELIRAGLVTPDTRMVLTNAVYFKAAWDNPFQKSQTKDSAFYTLSSNAPPATVPMMHQTERMNAFAFPGGKIVEIPYRDTDLVMDVIVPDDRAGLAALESKLDANTFEGMVSGLRANQVSLSLPKFGFSWGDSIAKPLGEMGIKQAFTGAADFSGISSREHLQIDDVIHKTFVAVDEGGTEAAAATAVLMRETAVFLPSTRMDVNADHPFVVIIRAPAVYHHTGVNPDAPSPSQILFIGHVTNPKQG